MELIEREGFLTTLQTQFQHIETGEGHCVFISGESGIGKTSLVNFFTGDIKKKKNIFRGTCDALFTPRPLAPLYDILSQMGSGITERSNDITERTVFFTGLFNDLKDIDGPSLVIFEDVHWADEATMDFIKYFARRITQLPCLFILTYRDNEIQLNHPLRNVLGHLSPGSFTRIHLPPLSKQAVEKMAEEKNYKGVDVYKVTGGNPFYVSEILSTYSLGIPENVKDSILSAYNRTEEISKQVWELLSVVPSAFEIKYLEKLEPLFASSIESCLRHQILLVEDGYIYFKHELFRRTIESSLSPLKRILLNIRILELLQESFEQNGEIERIVHHAKNANDYELVVHYAPMAAKLAASVGSHIEASKLYLSAIEYYQGNDKDLLLQFYEGYAYECYLTNHVNEAIIYATKALKLMEENDDKEKISKSFYFLSRLWWTNDNLGKAEQFAGEAIKILEDQPSSTAKATAYSLMSQLKMFSDLPDECIFWGEKAIALAKELADDAILSYALGNVGSVKIRMPALQQEGLLMLQQSLELALQHSYHDYAGMAYTNLAYNGVIIKDYALAIEAITKGIPYCEEHDMDLWRSYLLTARVRHDLETGNWAEAYKTAKELAENNKPAKIIKIFVLTALAVIEMRRGDEAPIFARLKEAKEKAFETKEPQRILRALTAFLEYEWITGKQFIEKEYLDSVIEVIKKSGNIYGNSEFAFWLQKARKQILPLRSVYEGYNTSNVKKAQQAAMLWQKAGADYLQAIVLFNGNDDDKRKALSIMDGTEASAVCEKMKMEMRAAGIKNIPRGMRESTKNNKALLTERELEVLHLLREGLQNKEIASRLFISSKTVDHHITSLLYKLEVNSRAKAVQEAIKLEIIK